LRSPLCAQPTLAHRALVAMQKAGHFHRWINQNHDGLPQKAGLPQACINEIHGAWHAPDNPVVQMSGALCDTLYSDLLECERTADLVLAVGTSLCGMNADRIVTTPAERAARGESGVLGSVVVGLQRTVHDEDATLRIFARCDDVFELLAAELGLEVAPASPDGEYFTPAALVGLDEDHYVFPGLPYGVDGQRRSDVERAKAPACLRWDLRDEAALVIAGGPHAGAVGVADGLDREGNVRCRFTLKPKVGKLRAPVAMLLGRWWIQAAVEGSVPALPVVNSPAEGDLSPEAQRLRDLMDAYARPQA